VAIKAVVFDAYGTLYDVQSVAAITEETFPGYGEAVTQIWRLKQLEYTWLRSLMQRYEDFETVTRESLAYTLDNLGLKYDDAAFARIMEKYRHLDLYPDAKATLGALKGRKLAILSNGSPDMLNALVTNTGLDTVLDATISVDACRTFKPSPQTYKLIEAQLGITPDETLFVSSNGFDVSGAKASGLNVAWIERVTADALAAEFKDKSKAGPLTMFKAQRMRSEAMGFDPDYRIKTLADLLAIVAAA
jgi:2-haloacid dehalogenase